MNTKTGQMVQKCGFGPDGKGFARNPENGKTIPQQPTALRQALNRLTALIP
jgi:hypothetical protein